MKFDITLSSWELEPGVEVELRVTGSYEPGRPARLNCAPEDATPAEGGVCEDLHIFNEQGCPLPEFVAVRLAGDRDFREAVEEQVTKDAREAAFVWAQEAAEARDYYRGIDR